MARRLAEVELIDERTLQPLAWEKRQFDSDRDPTSNERKRRQRERQRQSRTVTDMSRGTRHEVTPLEEEVDTDTESSKQRAMGGIERVGAQAPDATAQPPHKPNKRSGKPLPKAPDWLPAETWQAFIDHRQAKHKPLTPQGANMTLRDLDKARSFGHDPTTLVELAIASGWTGCVFADKHFVPAVTGAVATTPHNGRNRPFTSKQEHIAAKNEAALNEWLNSRGQQVNVIEGECHEIH